MSEKMITMVFQISRWFPFIVLFPLFIACDHTDTPSEGGAASVRISVVSVDDDPATDVSFEQKPDQKGRSSGGERSVAKNVQTIVVPFGDDMQVLAELSPATSVRQSNTSRASSEQRASAEAGRRLGLGVWYRVLVYTASGALVDQKDYRHGDESMTGHFELDGGTEYIFVAYSVNKTDQSLLPPVTQISSLASASIEGVDTELLFFQKKMTVVGGVNRLDLALKHKFSQITTTIAANVDASAPVMQKGITQITNARILPTYTRGSIALLDGTLSFDGVQEKGAHVVFDQAELSPNTFQVVSEPTLLISEATNSASLSISSMTINDITNSLRLPGLRVTPGVRYNLNITFLPPCWRPIPTPVARIEAAAPATVKDTTFMVEAENGYYGIDLDFYTVNSSFQVFVNDVALSTEEFVFNATGTSPANVKFRDELNSLWGSQYPRIEHVDGWKNGISPQPIVKVVIDGYGNVNLFGWKSSSWGVDPSGIYRLETYNGNILNQIPWSMFGTNKIRIKQTVEGTSELRFIGVKKARCRNPAPTG